MDNSFFSYLARLELMGFFSGFPLVYALIFFIAGSPGNRNKIKQRLIKSLPLGYALVGTLYLGLQLKNLYPDYSLEHIQLTIQNPFLTTWGLLSILFWIPLLSKKPVLALIHSLVIFSFLLKDIISHAAGKNDSHVLKNDMSIYTNSLLLNIISLFLVAGFSYLVFNKRRQTS